MASNKETAAALGAQSVAPALPSLPDGGSARLTAIAAGHPEAAYRYESASKETVLALFEVHGAEKVKPFRDTKATVGEIIAKLGTEKKQ